MALPNTKPVIVENINFYLPTKQFVSGITPAPPMLIVGGNNFISTHSNKDNRVFDIHLWFQPQNREYWKAGIVAIDKMNRVLPIIRFEIDKDINVLMKRLLKESYLPNNLEEKELNKLDKKRILWFTKWIYRLPKISLKDVLHFETYK